MGLLENPGQKLKSAVQVLFILGIVFIVIVAVLCLAVVSHSYHGAGGFNAIIVIAAAVILFLALWVQALFISAYADMAAQLKKQTEILQRIESRLSENGGGFTPTSSSI